MNRVFKSIWNSVTQSWTAVSEVQRAKRKSGKKAVVLGLLSLNLFNMPVLAVRFLIYSHGDSYLSGHRYS